MKQIEIDVPSTADLTDLDEAIEDAAAAAGLHVTLRGGLTQYPGATHWHFKRGDERGTLEITWWPREMRLWLSVHDNRDAQWIEPAMRMIQQALNARLHPIK
jgi:hypothetical protein